ncbi:ABC transporter permease [Aquimarina rhabdastrellae]
MNFEYFIAKRLIKSTEHKNSISGAIIKIAIAAIAIGMIMMLITIATGIGLQQKIREKVAAFKGHVTIVNYDNNNNVEHQVPVSIHQDFYPEFTTVEGINHIQAIAAKGGILRTETDFEGVVVKGIGKDYDWNYFKEYLVAGRLPDFSSKINDEILISQHIANRLGLTIGDKANTYFRKTDSRFNVRGFVIVGIYNSGFEEFDKSYLLADIRHIQKLNKWKPDEVGGFEVFIDDFSQINEKGNEIYEAIPSELDSQPITYTYRSIFEWLKLFDLNIIGIIAIIIIVAGINMITALLVLILERTPMIGILKALGSSDWSIRKVFLYNAAYLIAIGLFWGNIIGIGLLFIQKYFNIIKLNPVTYHVNTAPVYINIGYIFLLNVGTLLLCLLMLVIPSYVISRISPVKAIRFE